MAPAAGIHVADGDQVVPDQRQHLLELEFEHVARQVGRVAAADQFDDLGRVVERVVPAAQAGGDEGAHPFRVVLDFLFRGEQVVAIEIDARRTRRKAQERLPGPLQEVGLPGAVGRHRVDAAGDQILDGEAVIDAGDAVERDAFPAQVGLDLGGLPLEHHALADQVMHAAQRRLLAGDDDLRRMLEDRGQRDDRPARLAGEQQAAAADAVLGLAGQYLLDDVVVGHRRPDRHVEAGVVVVALGLGRVIAGELEGVLPFELQRHRFAGTGRRRAEQGGQQAGHQEWTVPPAAGAVGSGVRGGRAQRGPLQSVPPFSGGGR